MYSQKVKKSILNSDNINYNEEYTSTLYMNVHTECTYTCTLLANQYLEIDNIIDLRIIVIYYCLEQFTYPEPDKELRNGYLAMIC